MSLQLQINLLLLLLLFRTGIAAFTAGGFIVVKLSLWHYNISYRKD